MTHKNRTYGEASRGGGRLTRRVPWPMDARLAVARAVVEQYQRVREVAEQFGVAFTTAPHRVD